jgi:hypothetical protein
MGEAPLLENVEVKALEDENEERIQDSSSDSSSSEPGADGNPAFGVVHPVVDGLMVVTDTAPSNAASSCSGVAMPMTPGLAPLTPEWIPVPPPDDLIKYCFHLL